MAVLVATGREIRRVAPEATQASPLRDPELPLLTVVREAREREALVEMAYILATFMAVAVVVMATLLVLEATVALLECIRAVRVARFSAVVAGVRALSPLVETVQVVTICLHRS
jgi:hypothetical protein